MHGIKLFMPVIFPFLLYMQYPCVIFCNLILFGCLFALLLVSIESFFVMYIAAFKSRQILFFTVNCPRFNSAATIWVFTIIARLLSFARAIDTDGPVVGESVGLSSREN